MAQKLMFDQEITETDGFIDLPNSSKALYFLLGIETDTKGFTTSKLKVMRIHRFSQGDLDILVEKGFVTLDTEEDAEVCI